MTAIVYTCVVRNFERVERFEEVSFLPDVKVIRKAQVKRDYEVTVPVGVQRVKGFGAVSKLIRLSLAMAPDFKVSVSLVK